MRAEETATLALKVLDERGWGQGPQLGNRACLTIALYAAAYNNEQDYRAALAACGFKYPDPHANVSKGQLDWNRYTVGPVQWNDAVERTEEDVRLLLKRVAAGEIFEEPLDSF